MSPKLPGGSGSSRDTKSVLYEAAVEAVQDRAAQAKAKGGRQPRKSSSGARIVVMLVLAVAGALILVLRPGWLVGPLTIPEETPAIAAASLRVELVRERDMVLRYQRQNGALPSRLEEAGVSLPNLRYRPEGAGFSLSGMAGDSLITIRSTDSVTVFLGDSFSRLRHRTAQ